MDISFLLFQTAGKVLAVPTSQARQVLPLEQVAGLPGTGGSILGLMSAAGRAVPVLNFASFTELVSTHATIGLLCEHRTEQLILPIDEVIGTVTDDTPPPSTQILQEVSLNYRDVTLLNMDALLDHIATRLQPI